MEKDIQNTSEVLIDRSELDSIDRSEFKKNIVSVYMGLSNWE